MAQVANEFHGTHFVPFLHFEKLFGTGGCCARARTWSQGWLKSDARRRTFARSRRAKRLGGAGGRRRVHSAGRAGGRDGTEERIAIELAKSNRMNDKFACPTTATTATWFAKLLAQKYGLHFVDLERNRRAQKFNVYRTARGRTVLPFPQSKKCPHLSAVNRAMSSCLELAFSFAF